MGFNELYTQQDRLDLMKKLSTNFALRAAEVDESGSFPFENIRELIKAGYTTLTVPSEYGGKEITLLELVQLQEKIAVGDGSTALAIGWHMGIIKHLGEKLNWEESIFRELCTNVLKGSLVNSAASELQTGSPTRGGRPQTIAEKSGNQWTINGRKSFTTMSPMLDYFIVSAGIIESDEIGNFLIPRTQPGISIKETWDSIAMRGTGSHDLILKDVVIDEKYYVESLPNKKKANGSLLHIPACYLGIAQAAQNEAIRFARSYAPNSITGTIIHLPNVQQKMGEIEFELLRARHFLYSVAKRWDEADQEEKEDLLPELGAAKMAVTNSALSVVDLAMRIMGARSLSQKSPLQRYYRDVRAGLHNPPMDDITIQLLSRSVIEREQNQN
ncbi:acyl-CoA/acyl-ACP dehydrogenase [Bacillus sp. V3B]|uniref:acyl-CoA dehydrogenase family protein n=1 Tax=Bacillus sp. V3B TaxID=2804915 RepID=UPI00210C4368|nr:acyl-CoA dehydrogenase family protein [Bacillus sp. V3B]MCQ6276197.1 acyl-CoA/acyl-ACP dehydrogenase [Bacillus sp. V3B]